MSNIGLTLHRSSPGSRLRTQLTDMPTKAAYQKWVDMDSIHHLPAAAVVLVKEPPKNTIFGPHSVNLA